MIMKQIEKLTLAEVEKLLDINLLSKEVLITVAEKRFGIPSAKHKTKKELRELISIAMNHERSMEVIGEIASV